MGFEESSDICVFLFIYNQDLFIILFYIITHNYIIVVAQIGIES